MRRAKERWQYCVAFGCSLEFQFLIESQGTLAADLIFKRSLDKGIRTKFIATSELDLLDENQKTQGMLSTLGSNPEHGGTLFILSGTSGKPQVMLTTGKDGPSLDMMNASGVTEMSMNVSNSVSWVNLGEDKNEKDKIKLTTGSGESSIEVSDSSGFTATLGKASLTSSRYGETRQTSGASLTLFGKDGHILWMSPKQ